MDSRLSHALVAVAAVGLTVIGYSIYDALSDTARMLSGDGAVARGEARADRAEGPDEERRREGKGEAKGEGRGRDGDKPEEVTPGSHIAPPEGTSGVEPERGGRVAARAAELGLTPHELRERRAERDGITVDEFKARKDARSDWRAEQDPAELQARKEARRATLTPEQQAELQAMRDQRHELFEADPSLKDAAEAMKKLRDMAGEAPPAE